MILKLFEARCELHGLTHSLPAPSSPSFSLLSFLACYYRASVEVAGKKKVLQACWSILSAEG